MVAIVPSIFSADFSLSALIFPTGYVSFLVRVGYLSSLITKAEKYVSLPEISLQNLTTRQATALIELIKTATDTFSCLNAGIQMEFCDLPQFICSAEKCENGRFAIEYKRKE